MLPSSDPFVRSSLLSKHQHNRHHVTSGRLRCLWIMRSWWGKCMTTFPQHLLDLFNSTITKMCFWEILSLLWNVVVRVVNHYFYLAESEVRCPNWWCSSAATSGSTWWFRQWFENSHQRSLPIPSFVHAFKTLDSCLIQCLFLGGISSFLESALIPIILFENMLGMY